MNIYIERYLGNQIVYLFLCDSDRTSEHFQLPKVKIGE